MRENLYKAKRKDNNEWIFGSCVHQTDYYGSPVDRWFIVYGTTTEDNEMGFSYEVYPDTVCQYIRKTDKNGVKVFDGDICVVKNREAVIFYDETNCIFTLLYGETFTHFGDVCGSEIEVVGNIHG